MKCSKLLKNCHKNIKICIDIIYTKSYPYIRIKYGFKQYPGIIKKWYNFIHRK